MFVVASVGIEVIVGWSPTMSIDNVCLYTLFFYKEPTSRPSSKSSLFIDLKSANYSTKSSLIVP